MAALMKSRESDTLRPFGWEDLDEWFEDFGERGWLMHSPHWMDFPRIETYEKNGKYVIKADLPGVDPKEVDISVEGDHLVVKGERRADTEVKRKHFYRKEVHYGSFERWIPMPEGLKTSELKAKYRDGVLEISAPYEKGHARKKIAVQIEKTA